MVGNVWQRLKIFYGRSLVSVKRNPCLFYATRRSFGRPNNKDKGRPNRKVSRNWQALRRPGRVRHPRGSFTPVEAAASRLLATFVSISILFPSPLYSLSVLFCSSSAYREDSAYVYARARVCVCVCRIETLHSSQIEEVARPQLEFGTRPI